MKFIHAADIHLDSPLRGLAEYGGAPVEEMRGATRRALENLVELALDEQVALVLLAGDIYDSDWRDFNTGLFFASQMSCLGDAGIRVFLVNGNHDALSQITRSLDMPQNVVAMAAAKAETVLVDDIGVAVHGQSFATRATTEDLASGFPDAMNGYFNVGLLHTSATGCGEHETCAPCNIDMLVSKGYDYWALGHIHKRHEPLRPDKSNLGGPWVVYPGNTQGRHAKETGCKGCTLATVTDGKVETVEHRALDVVRWCKCVVDAAGAADGYEVRERVQQSIGEELAEIDDRFLAVRVEISGLGSAHCDLMQDPEPWINQIRADATDVGRGRVWVEKVKLSARKECEAQQTGDWSSLFTSIGQIAKSEELQKRLLSTLYQLRDKLPIEVRQGDEPLNLNDPALVVEALPEVEQILAARLLGKGS